MKLRNKLIPLMSVITATGCAAPIATSCSAGNLKLTDITKNYVPTIDKAEKTKEALTEKAANDLYFSHVKENPEILVQDVLNYEVAKLPSRIRNIEYYNYSRGGVDLTDQQQFICSNVTANVGVGNISVQKVKTEDSDENIFYAVSCRLDYVFGYTAISVDGTYSLTYKTTFSTAMTDIPTFVYGQPIYNPTSDTSTIRWKVYNDFNNTYLKFVPAWNYAFAEQNDISETYSDEYGVKKTESYTYSRDGNINRQSQLQNIGSQITDDKCLFFESYHLSDIPAGETSKPGLMLTDDNKIKATISSDITTIEGLRNALSIQFLKLEDDELELLSNAQELEFYIGTYAPEDEDEFDNRPMSSDIQWYPKEREQNGAYYTTYSGSEIGLGLYACDTLTSDNYYIDPTTGIVSTVPSTTISETNWHLGSGNGEGYTMYTSDPRITPSWGSTDTLQFAFLDYSNYDSMVVGYAGYDADDNYFYRDFEIEGLEYIALEITVA